MNYEETREQVDMILERVKALDNDKKRYSCAERIMSALMNCEDSSR